MKRGLAIALVYLGLLLLPLIIAALLSRPWSRRPTSSPTTSRATHRTYRTSCTTTPRCASSRRTTTSRRSSAAGEQAPGQARRRGGRAVDIGLGLVNSLFALRDDPRSCAAFMLGGGRRWLAGVRAPRRPIARCVPSAWSTASATRSATTSRARSAGHGRRRARVHHAEILGVPYAAALAALIFLLDLMPLVGATLGAVLVGVVTAVQRLPDRHHHLGGLLDRLPAGREQRHPAAHPVAGGRRPPVHRAALGAVRRTLFGVLGALLAIPRRGDDPDRRPASTALPARHTHRGHRRTGRGTEGAAAP